MGTRDEEWQAHGCDQEFSDFEHHEHRSVLSFLNQIVFRLVKKAD
jgi:hypothetical protein